TIRRVGSGRCERRAEAGRRGCPTGVAGRAATRYLACGRVRRVGALPWGDAVGCRRAALRDSRRWNMVVEAAMLVVREEQNRVVPAGAAAQRHDDGRHEILTGPDVPRRMLVRLEELAVYQLIRERGGVDEGHGGERAGRGVGCERRDLLRVSRGGRKYQ